MRQIKDTETESAKLMSKAVRNLKPREQSAGEVLGLGLDFWTWGDVASNGPMVLRDGPGWAPGDLMERTALFGEAVIRFSKKVPHTAENTRLISQVVGAATSIGANYCEADDSVSGKDFKKSIGTCRKESKETMFFLRMIAASEEGLKEEARALWREAKELNLIFGSIWRSR